jgi:gliding motility-associated-like protein
MGNANAGAAGGFSTLTRTAWTFPDNDHPYVLSTPRPPAPQIVCPVICENSNNVAFNATGSNTGYQWSFPPNATLVSGQGTSSAVVNWSSGTGWVTVFAPGVNGGCDSRPDSCLPSVNPIPDVEFSVQGDPTDNTFTFIDNSSPAVSWLWNFGDGSTSTSASPTYTYPTTGTFLVTLLVTGPGGCFNQGNTTVVVMDREFFVPNSFTPNDNGINEVFRPIVLNAEKYELRIFNRWGEYIFGSTNPDVGWDGTYEGKPCPLGVYVYQLTIRLKGQKEKVYYGHVNLIR